MPHTNQEAMMRRRIFLAAILSLGWLSVNAFPDEPPPDPCESPEACLHRLHELARTLPQNPRGLSTDAWALVSRFVELGDDAVPDLVELLADEDENVAYIAGAVLRDMPRIDPIFLDPILVGFDRGLGWLPGALGRIDSDDAAREAVQRFLRSDSSPHNQEAYAVKLQGRRAIPFILEAARCDGGCGSRDHGLLGHVLGEMGPERGEAGPGLLAIAADAGTDPAVVMKVLSMIGALGTEGIALEPDLLALRTRRPDLAHAVDAALVGVGSDVAGNVFAEKLRVAPDRLVLRDLAETRRAGRSAGPVVIDLVDHEDWDVRLGAARALGFIQYEPAVDVLTRLLDVDEDVVLNWVAAEALGRIGDPAARPALRRASENHWHAAVREAATIAIMHIDEGTEYPLKFHEKSFPLEFFAYVEMGRDLPACDESDFPPQSESGDTKLYRDTAEDRLRMLTYSQRFQNYVADERSDADDDYSGDDLTQWTVEEVEVEETPDMALRVSDGWLVGSDRGEWGGELLFVGDNGQRTVVLLENIEDVYRLGSRVIAVTGLAHLILNNGMLYRIKRGPDGHWSARKWKRLPGAPRTSWPVSGGEILINTLGGSILVSESGAMRMASCAPGGSAGELE